MAVTESSNAAGATTSVQHLVQQVYEASLCPEKLTQTVQQLTEALHGDVGMLLVRDQSGGDLTLAVTANARNKAEGAAAHCGATAAILSSRDLTALPWLDALWPHSGTVEQRDLADCHPPIDGGVSNAMVAPVGAQGALAIFRRLEQPRFDDTECAMLHSVAEQLCHAVALLARLAEQDRRSTLAEELIGMVAAPLLVVQADGRLVHANPQGHAALEQRDGIVLLDGRVTAQALRSNVRLQTLIAQVAQDGARGLCRPQALALSRGTDRRALGLILRPLCGSRQHGGDDIPTSIPRKTSPSLGFISSPLLVVIDVSAQDLQKAPPVRLLQDLFTLTPAEATLLQALMEDKRIEDHALARGVSVTTVRTQLAHLFRKTNTNRQSELVRLAVRAVGGLRLDQDPATEDEQP
jgi:DNA-binding CsgD family transcriptional regulator